MLEDLLGGWRSAVPVVVRLIAGSIFFWRGYTKVFTFGVEEIAKSFIMNDVPIPNILAFIASYLELLGGIALIIGIMVRWVAILFCIEMALAIVLVSIKKRFIPLMEIPLLLLTNVSVLLAFGAGPFSIDRVIGKKK